MQLFNCFVIKKGKLLMSHRSTTYPCYLPVLGEFSRSWSHKTYLGTKIRKNMNWTKNYYLCRSKMFNYNKKYL